MRVILDFILQGSDQDNRPHLKVSCYNVTMLGLLDSGASRTILGRAGMSLLKSLNLRIDRDPNLRCIVADGSNCEVVGKIQAPFQLENRVIVLDVLLVPALPHTLVLGVDFWTRMGVVPDLRSGSWHFSPICVDSVETSREFTVSSEQRAEIDDLVQTYFSSSGSGLGCVKGVEHRIEIESEALPIKLRNFPVSPKLQEIIDRELDSMLRAGIVEPSSSAWSSPILLIPKKDGAYRFCVDYRRLNRVTKKDAYPLPLISGILDKLRDARYLSSLDIKSAYWQVPVAVESREFTAFSVTGRGLFQFRRMPFGLSNAPATFQRLIDTILGHDLEPYVFQYLDDIVIVTPTFKKHVEVLKLVLERLLAAGLTVGRDKCQFCLPSLKYLGYVVDRDGLHVDPEKVSAIIDIPSPSTVKQVRQFLGIASWFRRFIPNFSTIAAPLTTLLRKKHTFVWSLDQEGAFRTIKEKLVSAPVLCCPDFSRPFVIQTDASDYGIGAVLTQEYPDGEHVISYISRSLNRAERNYSTTQKECLAVIWAVEKFRGYVEGYRFTVITDHHSLVWLQNLQNPTGKLCRWALRLQAFDFEIVHRKGSSHVVPDALSRAVTKLDTLSEVVNPSDEGVVSVSAAVTDRWYNHMLAEVEKNPVRYSQWRVDGHQLYKLTHQRDNTCNDPLFAWKRVIPKEYRVEVLERNHDTPLGGHLGVFKTYKRISQVYYWPHLRSDVARYVRGCRTCQMTKPEQLAPKGLLAKNPIADRPWKIISTDLVGPLPRSTQGYTSILVVSDCFSKFCRFFPLRKATAKNIVRLLEEEIILLFGAPQLMLMDNGVQFAGRELQQLASRYGFVRRFTPVYHPQANPTERVNKTLKAMLISFAKNDQRSWDRHLRKLACAARTSVHQVTGFTPFRLTFGREFVSSGKLFGTIENPDGLDFLKRKPPDEEELRSLYKLVEQRLIKAQENSSRAYNLRRRHFEFSPGDLVWRKNYSLSDASKHYSSSLAPRYLGPFRVSRKIGYGTYILEGDDNKGRRQWHVKDLKPFVDQDPPPQSPE